MATASYSALKVLRVSEEVVVFPTANTWMHLEKYNVQFRFKLEIVIRI